MGNLNPYYNESFVFTVEQEILRVRNFTFRAWFILFVKSEVQFFLLKYHNHYNGMLTFALKLKKHFKTNKAPYLEAGSSFNFCTFASFIFPQIPT